MKSPVPTYCISGVFVLLGAFIALHAATASDRQLGIAIAAFFGGGAILVAAIGFIDRRPSLAPSPRLRVTPAGNTLDRLEIFASRSRVALTFGAAIFFLGCGFGALAFRAPVVLRIAGIASIGLGLFGVASAFVLATRREPVITLELDSLVYRRPFRPQTIVRYSDIAAIAVSKIAQQHVVFIGARDLEAKMSQIADPRARNAMLTTMQWYGYPWVLPHTSAYTAEQLAGLIREYVFAHNEGQPDASVPAVDTGKS